VLERIAHALEEHVRLLREALLMIERLAAEPDSDERP
jgi:hypothetical protein